jgi:Ferric iron reductase FhuF-like transporter
VIQDDRVPHAAPLQLALAAQVKFWPQPLTDAGPVGMGWITAADLFADSAAIDDLFAYQRSFTPDLDLKGQAAYAIGEYSYMFAITAAAPFVGFGLVPDLSPRNYALRFDTRPIQHNDRTVQERLARVRFLDTTVSTDNQAFTGHADVQDIVDRAMLCERLRHQVEAHFEPIVAALRKKSGLSRNALWRLVGDSLSQLFLDAGQCFGCVESAKVAALAILKQDGSPLNNRFLTSPSGMTSSRSRSFCQELIGREAAAAGSTRSRADTYARPASCRMHTSETSSSRADCAGDWTFQHWLWKPALQIRTLPSNKHDC